MPLSERRVKYRINTSPAPAVVNRYKKTAVPEVGTAAVFQAMG
jgi:hypothetical protein